MNSKTVALCQSGMMIALSTVLSLICAVIPFLNLPFGGGFTVAGMLPIVLVAYFCGTRQGLLTALAYSVVQLALGAFTGGGYVLALFTVGSDDFMGYGAAVGIILLDYMVAYTVLGFGGLFRKHKNRTAGLVLGTVLALSLRYLVHILSGVIFFGTFAEWFFSQEGFYAIGQVILSHFSGFSLSLIYAVFYNGLFMLPEIVITAGVAALLSRVPLIRQRKLY